MGSLRGHPDSHVTVYGVSQHWLYGLKRLGGLLRTSNRTKPNLAWKPNLAEKLTLAKKPN